MMAGRSIPRIGYWAALIAFLSCAAFVVVQILQLLRLIPQPWDEVAIYGFSQGIAVPFLLAFAALHHVTTGDRRFWSLSALLFTVIYVTYVTLNYTVQLAVVIPSEVREPILVQTPHSLFWTVDALGYIAMGFATLLAIPVFAPRGIERWVRGFFMANALMTPVIAFVYFYPTFSETLLLVGLPWGITAPGSMLMLALYFKGMRR